MRIIWGVAFADLFIVFATKNFQKKVTIENWNKEDMLAKKIVVLHIYSEINLK